MAEAATQFYFMDGCPWCVRAHIALHEADVPHNSHKLDLWAGDQQTKDILARNPRGKVPMLEEAGPIVLYDSQAIIKWIQEHYSSRSQSLMPPPSDDKHRALVWQRLAESEDLAGKVTVPIRLKMQNGNKALTPEGEARCKELVGQLRKELGYWEAYLTSSEHVAGDEYTLADIAAAPFLLLAEHVGASYSDFPRIKQYVGRVRGREAVARVLEMHGQAGRQRGNVFGGAL